MRLQILFGVNVILAFVAWGIFAARYAWPWLRTRPLMEALKPVLLLHSFRFIGLAFLVPGVVGPGLPETFARPAAYGDLATALLALLALATLSSRIGVMVVWLFNVVGTADLLLAYFNGNRVGLGFAPGLQGAMYFIPTLLAPLLVVTHVLVFRLLFGREGRRVNWRLRASDGV